MQCPVCSEDIDASGGRIQLTRHIRNIHGYALKDADRLSRSATAPTAPTAAFGASVPCATPRRQRHSPSMPSVTEPMMRCPSQYCQVDAGAGCHVIISWPSYAARNSLRNDFSFASCRQRRCASGFAFCHRRLRSRCACGSFQ